MNHEGVPIEDYRGPLLAKPGTPPRGANFTHFPSNVTLTQPPRSRFRRRLGVLFYDTDPIINDAKRGLAWLIVAIFSVFITTLSVAALSEDSAWIFSCVNLLLSALIVPGFTFGALVKGIHCWSDSRFSSRPATARALSVTITVTAVVLSIFCLMIALWFNGWFTEALKDID